LADIGDIRGDAALVLALARGDSQRDAARATGVGLRTITRRMSDPSFVAAVHAERARLVQRAIGRLADSAAVFAEVLRDIANDPTAPANARVSAARTGLEIGARLRETEEMEERVARLEALLSQPLELREVG
jgi:hypothetical protein